MSLPKNSPRPVWTEAERRAAAARARAAIAARNGGNLDPVLTRKGVFAHPGSLFIVAAGLLFFAYVFNVAGLQVTLDAFFNSLNHSAQSENEVVAETVVQSVPYVKLGAMIIGAWVVLLIAMQGLKSGQKARRLSGRQPLTQDEFTERASQHEISPQVAAEAYKLLLPHYSHNMRTRLTDTLGEDLHLSQADIHDLYGNLLMRANRVRNLRAGNTDIETVLDLLVAVESSSLRFLTQREADPVLTTK